MYCYKPKQSPCRLVQLIYILECGPVPNEMATLPNIDGALCWTPQSLADAHYSSAVV